LTVEDIGSRRMSWGEALNLTRVLAGDPSSQVGAAVAGWQFAVSREWLALKAMADNYVSVKTSKRGARLVGLVDPAEKPTRRVGTASMSPVELQSVLDKHRASAPATAPSEILK
jgi:hypothetical protein